MPNGHIASKLQEVNLYKQNAMLARATYVNSRNNTRAIIMPVLRCLVGLLLPPLLKLL